LDGKQFMELMTTVEDWIEKVSISLCGVERSVKLRRISSIKIGVGKVRLIAVEEIAEKRREERRRDCEEQRGVGGGRSPRSRCM
jgi:hypothetical protein